MWGYHQKRALGAALGLPISTEEHHKSLLMVSHTVGSVCYCPGVLVYDASGEGHIFSKEKESEGGFMTSLKNT